MLFWGRPQNRIESIQPGTDPPSTLGQVPHRYHCPCCWAQVSLFTPLTSAVWDTGPWGLGLLSLLLLATGRCYCHSQCLCQMHSSSLSVSPHPESESGMRSLRAMSGYKNVGKVGFPFSWSDVVSASYQDTFKCGILIK